MLGAIIGDVIGSPYEVGSDKRKDFHLFLPNCRPTDDSVMTIAVGCACAEADCKNEYEFKTLLAEKMREIGRMYPDAGYGRYFYDWLIDDDAQSYGSYSNGSAMRVSPVAWVAQSLAEAERLAKWSAEITHDHPDAIKGAQAVAAAIYMARCGRDKEQIRSYIQQKYYDLDRTVDEIRPAYHFDVTCEGSVPEAIIAFLDSEDFEDAIRNAISLGGDGDTQAAIAGSIAEAYYGIPDDLAEQVFEYIDETLTEYYNGYAAVLYEL
jgi:ADP-ribosylglycohydrolase